MYIFWLYTNSNIMKKFNFYLLLSIALLAAICSIKPVFVSQPISVAKENSEAPKVEFKTPKASLIAIVIDDFGGYDRAGVNELLNSDIDITCAVIPFADNSEADYNKALENNKEVILHMPMEAHVNIPSNWYGSVYIHNNDTKETAINKLTECLNSMPEAKGFNIHIGSGVSQNKTLMKAIIEYAKEHNLYFLDSRTHIGTICEKVSNEENMIYLGRDEFLEPDHNKSYDSVKKHLLIGRDIALEKGHAIVIGHVGAHGGENTAKAIKDTINEIEDSGVDIVFLSDIYNKLNNSNK